MAGKKNKSHSKNKRSRRHTQSGGDPWATVLPMEYSGSANKHYFEAGSPELTTPTGQVSVSQGTISADGTSAGPDLYPTMKTMVGGGRRHRSRTHKRRAGGKKSSKRRSSRKTNQRGGGCGCGGSTPQLAGNYML